MLQLMATYLIQPLLKHYLKKERKSYIKGFHLTVFPSVFHPAFFFSTKFLVEFVSSLDLHEKTFCEPGIGTGLVSLCAYRQGASITSFDLNPIAVANAEVNFSRNFSQEDRIIRSFQLYTSDLFDQIPLQTFDYIAINPPYFFKEVSTEESLAWYCGKDGAYFEKLFRQLPSFIHEQSQVFMVLADNCDLERIERIAKKYQWHFKQVAQRKIGWEKNYIFKITQEW